MDIRKQGKGREGSTVNQTPALSPPTQCSAEFPIIAVQSLPFLLADYFTAGSPMLAYMSFRGSSLLQYPFLGLPQLFTAQQANAKGGKEAEPSILHSQLFLVMGTFRQRVVANVLYLHSGLPLSTAAGGALSLSRSLFPFLPPSQPHSFITLHCTALHCTALYCHRHLCK